MLRKTNTDFMLLTSLFSLRLIGSLWAIRDLFENCGIFSIEVHYFISFEDGLFILAKFQLKLTK